jgi:phage terminase large subunit-like protein
MAEGRNLPHLRQPGRHAPSHLSFRAEEREDNARRVLAAGASLWAEAPPQLAALQRRAVAGASGHHLFAGGEDRSDVADASAGDHDPGHGQGASVQELGTRYRALSADATTAYGLSPVFIVHDELGQVRGPRSELYEALETATAHRKTPLSVIISTQAPTDADLLSVLIDDAAFGDFQNAGEVLAMAEDARRMPAREPEYRNLILNQRVETASPFISRSLWQSCAGEVIKILEGLPVYAGLDLSETNDLTAFVAIAPVGGVWHVKPTFWLPGEGLRERSRQDRVPYDLWASQGHLIAIEGAKSVEYEHVAGFLRRFVSANDVRQVAFDRWNFRHLRPWLLKVGFDEEEIEARFVEFGQGFQSMSPALRELESALLTGKVAHGDHPVLSMCAANAVVQRDPAGNRKLAKHKSRGRIDGMISLAMAMSLAATHVEESQMDISAFIANPVFA